MRSSAAAAQSTRSPNVSCAAAEARSKLPFEVSDNLAQHLTLVSDPKDIVSEVELDRKRRLHLLIQRYISQIQDGCKNPSCTTPTCFSCRKRLAGSPVRRYTALSARTLACFLADARDPEAALCPYEPIHPAQLYSPSSVEKVSPSSSRRASAVSGLATGHKAQQHVHVNGTRPTTTQRSSKQTARRDGEEIHAFQTSHFANWAFLRPSPQPTKDPKSFTQALFDTLPLKLLEWIPPMPRRSTPQSPHVNQTQSKSGSAPEQLKANMHVEQRAAGNDRKHDTTLGDDEDDHEEAATTHLNGSAIANGHAKEPKPSILPRMSARKRYPATGGPSTSTPSVAGAREISHESTAQQSSQGQENDSENSPIFREPRQNPQHASNIGPEGNRSLSVPTLKSLSTGVLEELEALHNGAQNGICKPELSDFFKQSLYYCLKDPCRIAASFEAPEASGLDSGAPSSSAQKGRRFTLNAQSVRTNLRSMSVLCSWREIIRNVLIATHSLYIPAISRSPPLPTSLLNNRQAARVCVIGLYALSEVARTSTDLPNIAPTSRPGHIHPEGQIQPFPKRILGFYNILDDFESLSLLEKIVNVVANRWTLWDISKAHRDTDLDDCAKRPPNMIQSILDYMADDANQMLETGAPMKASIERAGPCDARPDILDCGSLSVTTLYWLRALMVRNWDGKASVRKSETVGNVLQILAAMYEKHRSIGLEPADFWTKMLAKRFDPFDMPLEWLAFRSDHKTVHLLSYSFLFPPETLVTYFRAINYSRMTKSTESAALTKRAYDEFVASADSCQIPVAGREALEQRLGIIGPPRFVIQVRRDDVVTDAIKQIWRHQKRELLKPLKVRMGTDEGEEGVDSGGVQQEMFRVLFGEALDPSYGMFTVDEETRMTWFQPQSLEPLFNFEALGILMSLAVYNSITLPITFPIAFYRKLLGFKVKKLAHILDGWPVLARNLQSLLDWKDGDVGDVFLRTYEFSYEAFGQVISVDMERHQRDMPWPPHPTRKGGGRVKTASFDVPPVPSERGSATIVSNSALQADDVTKDPGCQGVALEASLVTNANREQYVKDYVFWLTDKSIRPQFEAFARGFYTCLDRTALSIFTPEALQSFIEGVQEIDLDGLQASTAYDGYTADDEIVQWFWEVVKSWDHQKRRLLLEFITASDRVPVNGVTVIGLVIQCAGRSDEMLPRSMTCFATFLLPLYSSKDVLERMLGIAIEHAKGFGTI